MRSDEVGKIFQCSGHMKKAAFLISISLSVGGCITDTGEQLPEPEPASADSTVYYWGGGEKVLLDLNRRTVIGIYKPDSIHPGLTAEIMYFDVAQTSPLRSVVALRGFDPDQFEWLSFGYTFHGAEMLATNRISFSLKAGYTLQSLDSLIRGDAVFDSTPYGTPQLKVVRQDGNIFDVANRVYESGLVKYCLPDFIALIVPLDIRTLPTSS